MYNIYAYTVRTCTDMYIYTYILCMCIENHFKILCPVYHDNIHSHNSNEIHCYRSMTFFIYYVSINEGTSKFFGKN